MLYLLEDNKHYKVGYSQDEETLIKRIKSYKTHNPTFIYLGLREGTKEDEKEYHKLLNCNKKSEWSCDIDSLILEKIKLDFKPESYLPSLFRETIELYEDDIPEPYSMIRILFQNIIDKTFPSMITIILCCDGVYINVNHNNYKVINNNLQIKTFYNDYDVEYGEKYTGFEINGIMFYDLQIRGYNFNQFGNWTNKDSELYKKLIPIMKNFKLYDQNN